MRVIGLTGGIATGKSTVARMLEDLGAVVLDADEIAREVVAPGTPGLREVVEAFGPGVLDPSGALDRKAMARRIFADEAARRRLEAIIHPKVFRRYAERLEALRKSGEAEVVVLVIPLLFETGKALDLVDQTVVVHVDPAVQLRRLMARDGLNESEALQRIDAQMPLDEKVRRADRVIENGGLPADTRRQVEALWKEWIAHADRPDRA